MMCFEELLLTWRECHFGVQQMIQNLGDGPAGVEVVMRNVSEIDGFKFEYEGGGETIRGRFVDTEFDEKLCSNVDSGEFTFVGKELKALKCNYKQGAA